jgi:hypothetical protein
MSAEQKTLQQLLDAGYTIVPPSLSDDDSSGIVIGVIFFIILIIIILSIAGSCTNGFTNIHGKSEKESEPKNLEKGKPCVKLGLPQNKYCKSNSCSWDFAKAGFFCN